MILRPITTARKNIGAKPETTRVDKGQVEDCVGGELALAVQGLQEECVVYICKMSPTDAST